MAKRKILIVDDEESFGFMVKVNLEKTRKYEVMVETEGKNALLSARDYKPDLIFLDILMPDVDGGEIFTQLQKDPELKSIPVVFLTALVRETEVSEDGHVIGGHPFISKPVTIEELIAAIENNIRRTD